MTLANRLSVSRLNAGGGGGGAAPVPNPIVWLNGADESTFIMSGPHVSTWNDSSGNENHATANGFMTLDRTINGYNLPDVSSTYRFALPLMSFVETDGFTIILVAQFDSTASRYFVQYSTLGGNPGFNMNLGQNTTGSTTARLWYSNQTRATLAGAINTSPQLWCFSYNKDTGAYYFEVGASSTSGTISTGQGPPDHTQHTFPTATAASLYFDGIVAEYVINDGYLSGSALTDAINAVKATWGI